MTSPDVPDIPWPEPDEGDAVPETLESEQLARPVALPDSKVLDVVMLEALIERLDVGGHDRSAIVHVYAHDAVLGGDESSEVEGVLSFRLNGRTRSSFSSVIEQLASWTAEETRICIYGAPSHDFFFVGPDTSLVLPRMEDS